GDVNGDGILDLATVGFYRTLEGAVTILLGNGDGSFQEARYFDAGRSPQSMAVGDVNGDGVLDLAVTGGFCSNYYLCFDENVRVFLGNGDGAFREARRFDAGVSPESVAVGDVNGDGLLDLTVANSYFPYGVDGRSVSVLLGNGGGTFQTAQNFPVG